MDEKEDWRRRQREGREIEPFWDRERENEQWRRDYERGDWRPGGMTAGSSGGWSAPAGSPSAFVEEQWVTERWSVPRGRFTGRGPKNYQRSNERIREDVSERLEQNPDLDASEIEVFVEDREVRLEGRVEDRRSKRLAEDLAEAVPGVKDVHNHLKVEEGFFANLFGRRDEELRHEHDEDRSRRIPIASEMTERSDRPGGSTGVAAVGDTAITGADRTAAVSDTTPPSSTMPPSSASRTRPRH